jgi:hypothetical protein
MEWAWEVERVAGMRMALAQGVEVHQELVKAMFTMRMQQL